MRIWDIPTERLCKKHLLAEHKELHQIWKTITKNKKAWKNHPETKRWKQNLEGLWYRHYMQVQEFAYRGYKHKTPLPRQETETCLIKYLCREMWEPFESQQKKLRQKKCGCHT